MTTETMVTPFDGYRAGCDAALRMLERGQDWRNEWHALQGRRIERDRDATHRLQAALANAKDWSTFSDALQRALRDYMLTSVSIWQDAGEMTLRAQSDYAATTREWLSECQTDWLREWNRLGSAGATSMPWRDWIAALERGVTEAGQLDGAMAASPRRRTGTNAAQEGAHAR